MDFDDMPEIFGDLDNTAPETPEIDAHQAALEAELAERQAAMPPGLRAIPESDIPPGHDYRLITTKDQLEELRQAMLAAPILAVDTETTGVTHDDVIVGVAISTGPRMGVYIPLRHERDGMAGFSERYPDQLDPLYVFDQIGPILQEKVCVGHNVKFDLKMFWKEGVDINYVHDTLIMAALIGVYQQGKRSLEDLVKRHFNHDMIPLKSFFVPIGRKRTPEIRVKVLDPKTFMQYAAEDADYSFRLFEYMIDICTANVSSFIYDLEMKLVRVVADMEMCGVPSSKEFLKTKEEEAGILLERLERELVSEIREAVEDDEYEINFNSPKQLGELVYDRLGIPYTYELTASGGRSTAGHIMEELAKTYPIMQRIHAFRLLKKLRGTFLAKMYARVEEDDRIRGSFNQSGTASGRFSSSDPNLQNIPKDQTFALWAADDIQDAIDAFPDTLRKNHDEDSWEAYSDEADSWGNYYLGIAPSGNHYMVHNGEVWQSWRCPTRQFITASEGNYIVEADYSQIELRVMAGESREPSLLEAYATGDDVHTKTASVLFGVPFENVTKVQRSIGKTINFGLLYGAGPKRISQELGITLDEAKSIVDKYFANLPMINTWINTMKQHARTDGYAETAFKRRRYFPEIKTGDHGTRAREEREAVNHHIQGAAADVMKIALTRLHTRLREYFGDKVRVMCTVHDSVILEVHDSIAKEDLAWVMKDAMEFNPFVGKWPDLEIDLGYGPSWAETEKLTLPEGHPAPSKIDVSTLPRLRNRLVGREYEGDMSGTVEFTPVDMPAEPEDESKVELTAEEVVTIVDTDTGEVTEAEEHEDIDVHWKLDVANYPLNKQQGSALRDFLASKTSENARGTLTMAFKEQSGAEKAITYKNKYTLSFDDELHLKLILGPCKLRQDSSHFDVDAVISRLGT